MYGWLCGIIFSKLALSVQLRGACQPSSSGERARSTTSSAARWLKTSRSSRVAGARVEVREVADDRHRRGRGSGACMASRAVQCRAQRAGRRAAPTTHRGAGAGVDRRRARRQRLRVRTPARSCAPSSALDEHAAAWLDQHEPAAATSAPAGQPGRQAGGDRLSSVRAARRRCGRRCRAGRRRARRRASPTTPKQLPWYGVGTRDEALPLAGRAAARGPARRR